MTDTKNEAKRLRATSLFIFINRQLDEMLPEMRENGDRVLIFSQFTMALDILQKYLKIRGHKFMRLDGQTPVQVSFLISSYLSFYPWRLDGQTPVQVSI